MSDVTDLFSYVDRAKNILATPDAETGNATGLIKKGLETACRGYSSNPLAQTRVAMSAGDILSEVCNPWLASQGYTPPTSVVPFAGGQCPIQYSIDIQWTEVANGTGARRSGQSQPGAWGPINVSVVNTGVILNLGGNPFPETKIVMSNWGPFNSPRLSAPITNDIRIDADIKLTSVVVTPMFGMTDNCGDPPPVFTPGTAPTYNWNTTNNVTVGGKTYNVAINEPTVNEDNSINITGSINGTVPISLGSGGSPAVPTVDTALGDDINSADPTLPFNPLDVNEGDLPDPPDGFEYVGVAVRFSEIDDSLSYLPGTLGREVFPTVVGNLYLKLKSESGVYVSEGYSVRERQFSKSVDAFDTKCVGWQFNSRPYFIPVFTPILRRLK